MQRLTDIQRMCDAEVKLIQEQSALLLQKSAHGFSGELKSSSLIVENYIKSLLVHHLPQGYQLCSGYIVTMETIASQENLIQHDIIITDGRIPPIHKFGFGDIEVVPAEAVCGIIEIKRTLNRKSLDEAIEHLRATKSVLEEYENGVKSKRASSNRIGVTGSAATCAPLYAIVGLDCDKELVSQNYFSDVVRPSVLEFIDFVWGIAASCLTRFAVTGSDGSLYFPDTVSRNQNGGQARVATDWSKEEERGRVYGMAVSCFRNWINNTASARIDITKTARYFGVEAPPGRHPFLP